MKKTLKKNKRDIDKHQRDNGTSEQQQQQQEQREQQKQQKQQEQEQQDKDSEHFIHRRQISRARLRAYDTSRTTRTRDTQKDFHDHRQHSPNLRYQPSKYLRKNYFWNSISSYDFCFLVFRDHFRDIRQQNLEPLNSLIVGDVHVLIKSAHSNAVRRSIVALAKQRQDPYVLSWDRKRHGEKCSRWLWESWRSRARSERTEIQDTIALIEDQGFRRTKFASRWLSPARISFVTKQ